VFNYALMTNEIMLNDMKLEYILGVIVVVVCVKQ